MSDWTLNGPWTGEAPHQDEWFMHAREIKDADGLVIVLVPDDGDGEGERVARAAVLLPELVDHVRDVVLGTSGYVTRAEELLARLEGNA